MTLRPALRMSSRREGCMSSIIRTYVLIRQMFLHPGAISIQLRHKKAILRRSARYNFFFGCLFRRPTRRIALRCLIPRKGGRPDKLLKSNGQAELPLDLKGGVELMGNVPSVPRCTSVPRFRFPPGFPSDPQFSPVFVPSFRAPLKQIELSGTRKTGESRFSATILNACRR